MILVAPNDRKYWTEVGYGLEAILPDGKVGGFGREAVPFLRQNDYSGAVLLITQRVASVIAEDQKVTLDTISGIATAGTGIARILPRFGNLVGILIFVASCFFRCLGFHSAAFFFGSRWIDTLGGAAVECGWADLGTAVARWGGGGSWGGGGGGGFGGFGGGSFGGGGAGGSW